MGERKVIGLFKYSPRPKWRELSGAVRSLTVARDFQKFAKKNVGSKIKAGRSGNNPTCSSSKTSPWMTSDEDDDDDFAELSDFEIDEDETCETPRFSDTFSSCVSSDIVPNKIPKAWDEDPVTFLNFDSAIKSTPIEKQEPEEISSGILNFEYGVFASSTPKSNKMKALNETCEPKLALDLEGTILPMHQEKQALDFDAHLFDKSHKDVEIPEISMPGEVQLNNIKSPGIKNHLHKTIISASQSKTGASNAESGHSLENVPLCVLQKHHECDGVEHALDPSLEDMEIPEIYDEKGDPFHTSNSLKNSSHLDDTMCSKSEENDYTFNKSIYSVTSGRLDETQAGDSSSSFNKTLVPADEKEKNHQNISICTITKLPKLGRKLAIRRKNPKNPTHIPKKIVHRSKESDLTNIPLCFLVHPPPCAIEDLCVRVKKTKLNA